MTTSLGFDSADGFHSSRRTDEYTEELIQAGGYGNVRSFWIDLEPLTQRSDPYE